MGKTTYHYANKYHGLTCTMEKNKYLYYNLGLYHVISQLEMD